MRAVVVAASIGAVLLAAEAALRLAPGGTLVNLDIYREVDGLLLLRPNITRRHVTPLWDVTIRTNAQGWRDFDRAPAAGQAVAAGLGDSIAFGWGVELKQTLFSRLEAGANVRLLKAAVPGTGTSDQARVLERLLGETRLDAVVLAFFVGNDFSDVRQGGASQYAVDGGFLTRATPAATPSGKLERLAVHSRVLQLLRFASFEALGAGAPERFWDDRMREFAEVHLARPPARTEEAIRQTLASLDDVAQQCERADAPLLLIVLPRSYQVYEDELGEMLEGLRWDREDLDLDRPQRLLLDWAARRGVTAVDLLPAFRERAAGAGVRLFFTPDAHMTPAGHEVAARAAQPAFDALVE